MTKWQKKIRKSFKKFFSKFRVNLTNTLTIAARSPQLYFQKKTIKTRREV